MKGQWEENHSEETSGGKRIFWLNRLEGNAEEGQKITYYLGTVGHPCNPHTKGNEILRVGGPSHNDSAGFLLQVDILHITEADANVEAQSS